MCYIKSAILPLDRIITSKNKLLKNTALMLLSMLTFAFFFSPLDAVVDKNIRFQRLTIEDGLSQSTVNYIFQDRKGFMWFATQNGLNRYDGYNFSYYTYVPNIANSLSSGFVNTAIEDTDGKFWIGTQRGLNHFDPATRRFTRYFYRSGSSSGLSHNIVNTLCNDHLGYIWIGTQDGLNRLDPKTGRFTVYKHQIDDPNSISNNTVEALYEDRRGNLWVGTWGGGLNYFFHETGRFSKIKPMPGKSSDTVPAQISAILPDPPNHLWIASNSGLYHFNTETRIFRRYAHKPGVPESLSDNTVNCFCRGDNGSLWVGTENGLNYFNTAEGTFTRFLNDPDNPSSLSENHVYSLYKDKGGNLWVGTRIGGINRFHAISNQFISYRKGLGNPNSLGSHSVNCIYEDNSGVLWVGTLWDGLIRFDETKQKLTHYRNDPKDPGSLSHNEVHAITRDHMGHFWIGTRGGGLNRLDNRQKTFKRYMNDPQQVNSLSSNIVHTIALDSNQRIWIGTSRGLNLYDRPNDHFISYFSTHSDKTAMSNDGIRTILEDSDGFLWVGTENNGLNRFYPDTGQTVGFMHRDDVPDSLSHNFILCLYRDSRGVLWIGTDGGGINRLNDDNKTFSYYTTKEGLPNNEVYCILEDTKQNLWLSTNKGLSKFNTKTKTFSNYDRKDGLLSNEFNFGAAFKNKSGKMYFGGINGLNAFYPSLIRKYQYKPPVVITEIQLFNKTVPIGDMPDGRRLLTKDITHTDSISLSYKDSVLLLEFAALNYVFPEKNMYAYQMEGFEDNWNEIGTRRFATYTRLPPGDYVFKVKGCNNDGIWNDIPGSLKISIAPPYWLQWWFFLLCILAGLSIALFIHQRRITGIQNRKRELEIEVTRRTQELEKINYIVKSINREIDFTELLKSLGQETLGLKGIEKAAALVYDTFKEAYLFKAGLNWNTSALEIRRTGMSHQDVREIFIKNSRETYKDIFIASSHTVRDGNQPPPAPAMLMIRIQGKDNIAGYLIFANTTDADVFESQDLQLLVNLKDHIVSAFLKSKLLLEQKYTNDNLEEARHVAERERQAAETANHSKSQFLARMSHEIRTPLNGVIGFIDMLLDTELTEDQVEYARSINQSGQLLLTLIDDILDFSKIEAGQLTFESIDFDPEVTAFAVCDLIRPRIGNRPLEILCRIGNNVPAYIKSDPGRFRQILINLMGNAVKFTEAGEVELSLNVAEETEDKLQLHVSVRDTGIGIPPEKLTAIFEVFQQADGSITRKYGGSGLGLTICKQIAQMMGGDIEVESEPGVSTTFHFKAWVEKSTKKATPLPLPATLPGKKILITDDNQKNLEVLIHTLTQAGVRVTAVTNGKDTIDRVQKAAKAGEPFDLCILDIAMPGMSGYETAHTIRHLKAPANQLPLLAYSSSTQKGSQYFIDAGFNGYLPKPIQRYKLLQMLGRLLDETATEIIKQTNIANNRIHTHYTLADEAKHSIHILLAEDNAMNQKLARHMLLRGGYQLDIAVNGQVAVEMFTAQPDKYDLIFMDIQMPLMDGKEATRIIRERGFTDIPIIAMTAQTMKGDREKCLAAGMNDYISKPIKREKVFNAVKKWALNK